MTTREQFLERVHTGGAWAYLWTAEGRRSSWYPVGQPLPSTNGARSVYFGVHPCAAIPTTNARGEPAKPETVRARNELITSIGCLFSEFDAKDFDDDKGAVLAHIDGLMPAPSVLIDSGGGYHAYWLLREPWTLATDDDRERARKLQAAWVTYTGGDQGAKDLARVLRLPGTDNHKYDPPRPVDFVRCDLTLTYPLADLEAIAARAVPEIPTTRSTPSPSTPSGRDLSPYVRAALDQEVLTVTRAPDHTRNDTLNRAAFALGQLVGATWANLDRATVESELERAARACGLGEGETLRTIQSGLEAGIAEPRLEPADNRATVATSTTASTAQPHEPEPDDDQVTTAATEPQAQPKPTTWPYAIEGGRLVHYVTRGEETVTHKIADFWARITHEVTTEAGDRFYHLKGCAVRGGPFEIEIPAAEYAEDRRLKAALDAGAGARDPVRAGMTKHLGPAIKLCTGDNLAQTRRYYRTGWAGRRFLLPGRELGSIDIELPRKLPYSTTAGELQKGLDALEALIRAMGPERGAVLLSFILQGPAAALSHLRNERYALHVTGRTGSLKTSTCQAAMSVWGAGFLDDDRLIKWGEGATANAVMAMATHAHDLPLLLDNFKPGTGGGVRAYIGLIHNILEGGEKDRLNRAAQLKDTKPVFCWPLVTGEDVPDCDPASLARILVLPFAWQRGQDNADLTKAQELGEHLPTVGAAWLAWLESDTGRAKAQEAGAMFGDYRRQWAAHLRGLDSDMVNVLRVASNLASNQLAFWLLRCHPTMGDLFDAHADAHTAGLDTIAGTMAASTTQALEARAYLDALRELLASDRAYLLPKEQEYPSDHGPHKPGFMGWKDGDDGAYLLPIVARQLVEGLIGRERLGRLSNGALYAQLAELEAIATHDKGKTQKTVRIGGKAKKVLHIAGEVLTTKDESE